MSKIIRLSKTLANQIAAWEVVERPVSVVKELVENSIDANATKVKIEILWWWKKEIIVSDNWYGIDKDDLSVALEKYSTSKIKSLEDLYNVMTFWFRWEALSSISSVCDFEIISKSKESDFWYRLSSIWWEKSEISKEALNSWTKISVKNLFYNTPARLNYLKKDSTELNHIHEYLNNICLSYPEIWFEFISDWKTIFNYSSKETLETRIYNIYWNSFHENMIKIDYSTPWLILSWHISDPKVSFSNRNRQTLLVNNRVIKSPLIYKAISNAYNRFIPHSSFPAYVINLKIDPTQIDVNVHPRKLEIRFANEQSIFSAIYNSIQNKLDNTSLISTEEQISNVRNDFEKTDNKNNEYEKKYYTWSGTKFKSYSPYKDVSPNPDQWNLSNAINFTKSILSQNDEDIRFDDKYISNDLHNTPLGKIIGQAHNSYIIVQTSNWIKFLDQHALAERIIYEKLVSSKKSFKVQWLLIWESINLTPIELNILNENLDTFNQMWFDIELLSSSIIMINSIPDFIKKENIKNIFLWILSDIWEEKSSKAKTLDEVKNRIFAYTACRSAIKFWHSLTLFEINKLLNDSVLDYSATCPHWRPVVFDINLDELKWKYER